MTEPSIEEDHPPSQGMPTLWEENHGNLLLAFVASIFVIGASILAYNQTRFVPPRFPESQSILDPRLAMDAVQISENEPSVTINVSGAANDEGMMMVAIYDSVDDFNEPTRATIRQSFATSDGQGSLRIKLSMLPKKFAIAAFHDENGDGVLNRNRFEIPLERYGFSRNARGVTGPPSFDDAVVERPMAGEAIDVFVR